MDLETAKKYARQMGEIISKQGTHGFLQSDVALATLLGELERAATVEREACAKLAETMDFGGPYLNTGPDYKQGKLMAAKQIAEAIRGR